MELFQVFFSTKTQVWWPMESNKTKDILLLIVQERHKEKFASWWETVKNKDFYSPEPGLKLPISNLLESKDALKPNRNNPKEFCMRVMLSQKNRVELFHEREKSNLVFLAMTPENFAEVIFATERDFYCVGWDQTDNCWHTVLFEFVPIFEWFAPILLSSIQLEIQKCSCYVNLFSYRS